jgi:hypothetical protein
MHPAVSVAGNGERVSFLVAFGTTAPDGVESDAGGEWR